MTETTSLFITYVIGMIIVSSPWLVFGTLLGLTLRKYLRKKGSL